MYVHMAMFILLPSIRFSLQGSPQKTFFVRREKFSSTGFLFDDAIFFDDANIFEKKDRFAAIDFVQKFERLFTPRSRLRSARNFAKTRFVRFPTFHFSISRYFFSKFPCRNSDFGGAMNFWASQADSSRKMTPINLISGLYDFCWRGLKADFDFFDDF